MGPKAQKELAEAVEDQEALGDVVLYVGSKVSEYIISDSVECILLHDVHVFC